MIDPIRRLLLSAVAASGSVFDIAAAGGAGLGSAKDDERALNKGITSGADIITSPPAKYLIRTPLLIPDGMGLLLSGATIQMTERANFVIGVQSATPRGNRGMPIGELNIEASMLADIGLSIGLAVHRTFRDITICRATKQALLLDGTQNCLIENINTEDSAIGIEICNGAGNNLIQRCSFQGASKRHLLMSKNGLPGSRLHLFGDGSPSENTLFRCILEYGSAPITAEMTSGYRNHFRDLVVTGDGRDSPSIELGDHTGNNHFHYTCIQSSPERRGTAIYDRGYKNAFHWPSITNFRPGSVVIDGSGTTIITGSSTLSDSSYRISGLYNK